jgi:hypothetical protein
MAKTAKKQQTKSFWQKFHENRIKIALSTFVVMIPIALILTVYIGAYANNKRIHFDQVATPNTTYVNRFVDPDGIDALSLNITWYELKKPVEDDQGNLSGGYYKFQIFYTAKENYQVLNVQITPVLQTDWTDMRAISSNTFTILTSSRDFVVGFDYRLPVKPLWFVEVTDPNLYLKVDYTFASANNQVTKTAYVVLPLKDLNPTRVIS